jgi:pilus assembly protein CpaF
MIAPAPRGCGVDDALVGRIHSRIVEDAPRWTSLSTTEQRALVARLARGEAPLAGAPLIDELVDRVLARLVGLGPLEPLRADPTITEIMVNGGGTVWIERAGALERTDIVLDEATVLHLIERIVAPLGLRADRSSPIVDARLGDGSRVNAIIRPAAVDGPSLTIRRFGVATVPLATFIGPGGEQLLRWAVEARGNILVSGGTGAGKTTLLNALAGAVGDVERVITIEDTAELSLAAPHVVRLEARPANADGAGALAVRDLVRNALRMRPDRVIVGEVRGGEALDMLQAMNTGHDGSLSTCHANSPTDALRRLETMVLMAGVDLPLVAVREQVRAAIDLVVQVSRSTGGARRVVAIDEVVADPDPADPVTVPLLDDGRVVRLPTRVRRAVPIMSGADWLGR